MKIHALLNKGRKLVAGGSVNALRPQFNLDVQPELADKPVNGEWTTLSTMCDGGVVASVTTLFGNKTPGFPVGVFNQNKTFLGIANNSTEFATLWNADPVNSALATISPIANTGNFIVKLTTKKTPSLIGLRYYQFEHRGKVVLAAHNKSLIDWGTGTPEVIQPSEIINHKTHATLGIGKVNRTGDQHPARLGTYIDNGIYEGDAYHGLQFGDYSVSELWYDDISTQVYRDIGSAYKMIRVFHNEYGAFSVHDKDFVFVGLTAGVKNLSGNLPLYCDNLGWHLSNPFDPTAPFNFLSTNIADLKSVRVIGGGCYAIGNWWGNILPIAFRSNLKKSCVGAWIGGENDVAMWEIGKDWLSLRFLKISYSNGFYDGATVPPSLDSGFTNYPSGGTGITPTHRDNFFIGMNNSGRKPHLKGRRWLNYGAGAATVASAAARANLIAKGWYLG